MHNKETNLLKILVFSSTHLTCMKENSKVFPSFSAAGKEYSKHRQPSFRCLRGFQDLRRILSLCNKYNPLCVAQQQGDSINDSNGAHVYFLDKGKPNFRFLKCVMWKGHMFPFCDYILLHLVSISLFLFPIFYHSLLFCFLSPLCFCGKQLGKHTLEKQQCGET